MVLCHSLYLHLLAASLYFAVLSYLSLFYAYLYVKCFLSSKKTRKILMLLSLNDSMKQFETLTLS